MLLVSECLRHLKWEKEEQAEKSPWVDCESYENICWAGMKGLIQFAVYILAAVLILWAYSGWKSREKKIKTSMWIKKIGYFEDKYSASVILICREPESEDRERYIQKLYRETVSF